MFCGKCGKKINKGESFCTRCGSHVKTEDIAITAQPFTEKRSIPQSTQAEKSASIYKDVRRRPVRKILIGAITFGVCALTLILIFILTSGPVRIPGAVQICAGPGESLYSYDKAPGGYNVALKSDGTVVTVGANPGDKYTSSWGEHEIPDLSDWKDIVFIASDYNYYDFTGRGQTDIRLVGVKSDGMVVCEGCDEHTANILSRWRNIDSVSLSFGVIIGIKSDGTIVLSYNPYEELWDGKYGNVSEWSNIIDVYVDMMDIYGLKENGTVVTVGANDTIAALENRREERQREWTDIVAISSGLWIKADGTVIGKPDWHNIKSVYRFHNFDAGIKRDGTVVIYQKDGTGSLDVSEWKDIISLSTKLNGIVGLTADGTILEAYPGGVKPTEPPYSGAVQTAPPS